ncbi:hypothetical protein ACIJDS_001239 [Enterococcus faecalis]
MPKINLAIEADSATEMKEILSQLATGSVVEVTQSLNTANKKATEEVEKAAKKEPAKKEKGDCEEKRRSFYGLNLRHRTIENWGESRAY